MTYAYQCNGVYYLGDKPRDDPHFSLFAAWPGGVEDCPPPIAQEILRAGGWT